MSIAKQVESYILSNPVVLQALDMKLVNMSSLARQTVMSLGLRKSSFPAVLAACRRFSPVNRNSDNIIHAIKKGKLEFTTPSTDSAQIKLMPEQGIELTELLAYVFYLLQYQSVPVKGVTSSIDCITIKIDRKYMVNAMSAFDI